MTHFELEDSQKLIEWLLEKGLELSEAAKVLTDMECDDSLAMALRKVFLHRELVLERLTDNDWGNPITP